MFITYPQVNSSSSRVDPEDMFKPEIPGEGLEEDLTCHLHEIPATIADLGPLATGTSFIVIRHIDIDHEFLLKGNDWVRFRGFLVENSTYINLLDHRLVAMLSY